MLIDSHQHFWRLRRGDYEWLTPELEDLYRDFMPADLLPHLQRHAVTGTVLVQAARTEAETRFILDIAKSTPGILGVIGWLDMESKDFGAKLDDLITYGEGYLKGIRPMIQDIDDPNWILRKELDRAFIDLDNRGLIFEALVKPLHLKNLEKRLKIHPRLSCVLDHCGKPDIRNSDRLDWSEAIRDLANKTGAICKLSGLVTEASSSWGPTDIWPYIQDIIDHFGSERVMWGSDWPVLNLASNYDEWLEISQIGCKNLDQSDRDLIFGGNAYRIYKLSVTTP